MMIVSPQIGLGTLYALPVAVLFFGIGLSLGGSPGFTVNPARDLGPRIMHAILLISNKRDSDRVTLMFPLLAALLADLKQLCIAFYKYFPY